MLLAPGQETLSRGWPSSLLPLHRGSHNEILLTALGKTTMARILLLDGDACLWHSVCDILEGEGYTVCRAHNDYEGLPFARTGFMALTRGTVLYIVVF